MNDTPPVTNLISVQDSKPPTLTELCRDYVAQVKSPDTYDEREAGGKVMNALRTPRDLQDYRDALGTLWEALPVNKESQDLAIIIAMDILGTSDYIQKSRGADIGPYLARMIKELPEKTIYTGENSEISSPRDMRNKILYEATPLFGNLWNENKKHPREEYRYMSELNVQDFYNEVLDKSNIGRQINLDHVNGFIRDITILDKRMEAVHGNSIIPDKQHELLRGVYKRNPYCDIKEENDYIDILNRHDQKDDALLVECMHLLGAKPIAPHIIQYAWSQYYTRRQDKLNEEMDPLEDIDGDIDPEERSSIGVAINLCARNGVNKRATYLSNGEHAHAYCALLLGKIKGYNEIHGSDFVIESAIDALEEIALDTDFLLATGGKYIVPAVRVLLRQAVISENNEVKSFACLGSAERIVDHVQKSGLKLNNMGDTSGLRQTVDFVADKYSDPTTLDRALRIREKLEPIIINKNVANNFSDNALSMKQNNTNRLPPSNNLLDSPV